MILHSKYNNVMKNKQEWFNEKMAAVSPEITSEVQLSADIIARIDAVLKKKNMTQQEFLDWSEKAADLRDQCLAGKITVEALEAFLTEDLRYKKNKKAEKYGSRECGTPIRK